MNYQEYVSALRRQAYALPYIRQLAFAVLICKKLYPEYAKFVEAYQWGDADLLMDAIIVCQSRLDSNGNEPSDIAELIPKIDAIVPDTDDFGGDYLGSYALNASVSVNETLEFILDRDSEHIINIATYYSDTVDFRIHEENELIDLQISQHPVMIEAWNFILAETR
ncbi:DUF416 family protein [Flavihumibacter petaseus]|uniref:DUF416 family protein n=1 Tax=Flavihumibacter petaseus NBRC 106054 TaxID=1220578 RepID=A0A0E9MXC8_9BACT|nr:DUF416 family protein [Flavihumibacter petaseus]GAO41780.1 hypothetical protein FPE01S_01_07940 [Flavihumibacter petaseus NBRC 106054]